MKKQGWFSLVLAGILCAAVLFPFLAEAQDYLYATGSPTFGVNYPISNGYINVTNGNAHITIPLGSFQQRGGLPPIQISLEYDSRIWQINNSTGANYWMPLNVPNSMGGWRLTTGLEGGAMTFSLGGATGTITCNGTPYTGFYSIVYKYRWTDANGTQHIFDMINYEAPQAGPICNDINGSGYAIDGSGYYLTLTGSDKSVMTVYDSTGNEVYPLSKDPNGNTASIDGQGKVTDSMGRTLVTQTTSGSTIQFNVLKEGGGSNTFTVTTEPIKYSTNFHQSNVTDYNGSFTAIQSINLPDGSSYHFTYDSGTTSGYYGELTSMTLPTGGVDYLYYTNYVDSYKNANRWVTTVTESGNSTNFTPLVLTQCSTGGVGCMEQVTVARPSGDTKVYQLTLNNGAWNSQIDVYQGTSKLTTVTRNFNFTSYPCSSPLVCTGAEYITASTNKVTLDDTGQTAETDYGYTTPWTGKPNTIKAFDYGVSPTGTPSRETDYNYAFNVYGAALLTQVNQKMNGIAFAQTVYNYTTDGHFNLQSKVEGLSGGPQATSSYLYDGNGMETSETDPCGNATCSDMTGTSHTTTYTYAPACDSGILQQTTYPTTNGVSHVTKVNPDCSSGLPLSTTDQNNEVTTYGYDGLGRNNSIIYPDGGQTTYAYPTPTQMIQTRLISSGASSTLTATLDTYGRKSQVSLADPAGTDTVTFAYDVDGRLQYMYSPQRSTPSPTDGYTFTWYDALDRPYQIQQPDVNSKIQIAYSGNSTTVTDENGHQKRYVYDSFQDLTAVFEPNAGGTPSWETDYTYDAAGHVLSVLQKGDGSSSARGRTFFYDSLGRVTSESTPEAGTKSYTYDANGNMAASTTGLGTITYQYDALNRITLKQGQGVNYNYFYDTTSNVPTLQNLTLHNAIGRMVVETNAVNADSVFSYDPMGRLNWQASLTPSSFNNTSIITQATYDLAGDMTSLTYPDGRVVSKSYDSAQHLTGVQYASWNGTGVGSSYYIATGFAPPGEVTNATYGNGVQRTAGFNSRQSITGLSYETASQVLWSKQYTWAPNAQNLLKMADQVNPVQTANYTYDQVNRLVSATQAVSAPATNGSATLTINGSEQSSTSGTYTEGDANVTAQINGQGTDIETGVPYPPFPSVALNPSQAVTVAVNIGFSASTDGGVAIGKAGVNYQYSTNGGTSWTSFYTHAPVNEDYSYNGPPSISIGPLSGMSNLSQLQIQVVATAIGLGSDSGVTITASTGYSSITTATVGGYDAGTVTATVNGHSDSAPFQAGSNTATVAGALATAINNDGSSPVTATWNYGNTLLLTSKASGSASNYPVGVSWTHSSGFSSPSFTVSAPVALSGGQNSTSNPNAMSETCTIDPWGNQQQSGNFNFVQQFNIDNQISASGYNYDAAGDLVSDGIGNTWTYNVEGMIDASNGSDGGTQYVYDGLDQRVAQILGNGPSETIYFAGQQIALRDVNSGTYLDLLWAGNNLFAWVLGSQTSIPTYRLVDHLGSLAITTDGSGNVTGTNSLFPYGQVLSSNVGDPYPYAGLAMMWNGTYRAQYRAYETAPGRWTRPDPYNGSYDLANPQSFNRYVYVMNNPLAFTDPSGLRWNPCGGVNWSVSTSEGSSTSGFDYYPCDENGGPTGELPSAPSRNNDSGGGTNSAPSKAGCPAVPTAPAGANVNQNMAKAKIQGIFNPLAPLWFYNQVNYGGPMDYKTQGAQYEDFGNFNYGATGTAAYAPAFTLLRAAGWAQRGHPSSPQFGGNPGSLPGMVLNPFGGTAPYGDDPHDQQLIQQGIQYARMGCGG
jgi:RHS repeat-associated protein